MAIRHKTQFSILGLLAATTAIGLGLGLARHTIPAFSTMTTDQLWAVVGASALTLVGFAVLLVALSRRHRHA